jgi:hypothetical protein
MLSPRLENYRNYVLHSPTNKKQCAHCIYKVVVLLKFVHEFVFRQQLKLVPISHQITQLKLFAYVLRKVDLLFENFVT